MIFIGKRRILIYIFLGVMALSASLLGLCLGMSLGYTKNIATDSTFGKAVDALPTQIVDVNDRLITEFFRDEKREYISYLDLPKNLQYALITREDRTFHNHNGFAFVQTMKAVARGVFQGNLYGASTITQQLAGNRYEDRTDRSVWRKIRELWWSYQIEKELTKNEIIEEYSNMVPFGHGTNGVETASQFFFNHSSVYNNPAESAMLVIQIANPSGLYSPFRDPEYAKDRQYHVLTGMVENGFLDNDQKDFLFQSYWDNFNWQRSDASSVYTERLGNDKAPYFSEYIRGVLDDMLLGQADIYSDGYVVHTTLDLDLQEKADKYVIEGIDSWMEIYNNDESRSTSFVEEKYISLINMFSLAFNIPQIQEAGALERKKAKQYLLNQINPIIDMCSLVFDIPELKFAADKAYDINKTYQQTTTVQAALITLGNEIDTHGYIMAMVGGRGLDRSSYFNRAVQAEVQPGSSFKPLYYSAAISSRNFTPATRLRNTDIAFENADGTWYTPKNYNGYYSTSELLRTALKDSMNIPAVQVMDGIGFDAAIERAAELLGIFDPIEKAQTFTRGYPLAMGNIRISPLKMARAYSVFANNGRAIEPFGIRYIEDSKGNMIENPEEIFRKESLKDEYQILTPQENYIMVDLLRSTVKNGTLAYVTEWGQILPEIDLAGKTGTTQNWSAIWTCGFSPYYTTVIWGGFDEGTTSLGTRITGASGTGRVFSSYMEDIHRNLEPQRYTEPEEGIVHMRICTKSGQIRTEECGDNYRDEIFLEGTQPNTLCELHDYNNQRENEGIDIMIDIMSGSTTSVSNSSSSSSDFLDIEALLNSSGVGNLEDRRPAQNEEESTEETEDVQQDDEATIPEEDEEETSTDNTESDESHLD